MILKSVILYLILSPRHPQIGPEMGPKWVQNGSKMRSKTGPKRTKRQKVIPRGSDAQKGQFRRPLGAPKWTPERVQKSIKNHSRNLLTFRSHLGPVLRPMSLDFGTPNRPKFCRRRLCDGHDVNICAKPKNTGFPECF